MNKEGIILDLLKKGANINIIGDSLAAGEGSSGSIKTNEVILKDGNQTFYRRISPNSWWGKFETYLLDKFPKCRVVNNGCGGIFSSQIKIHLNEIYSDEDDIIILIIGTNDRKKENGMEELYNNLTNIVRDFKNKNKEVIVLTPNPSTVENESYPNRIYHNEDVSNVIVHVARKEDVLLVNNYNYIQEYLFIREKKIEEIIFGENCMNDGPHPSDEVQNLMFRNLINTLGLGLKIEGASW